MVVLDTTFLIAIEKGDPEATRVFTDVVDGGGVRRVPAAVWVEYLYVLAPPVRARATRLLESTVTFEPFTRTLADAAARLQHDLEKQGRRLPWHDLQVVATALHYGEDVVTNDARLADVPGLGVIPH